MTASAERQKERFKTMTKREIVAKLTEGNFEIVKASNNLYDIDKASDEWRLLSTASDIIRIAIKQINDSIPPWDA